MFQNRLEEYKAQSIFAKLLHKEGCRVGNYPLKERIVYYEMRFKMWLDFYFSWLLKKEV